MKEKVRSVLVRVLESMLLGLEYKQKDILFSGEDVFDERKHRIETLLRRYRRYSKTCHRKLVEYMECEILAAYKSGYSFGYGIANGDEVIKLKRIVK